MRKVISAFRQTLRLQFLDRSILLLSLFPILISVLLVALLGGWGFWEVTNSSREWLTSFFSSDMWIVNALLWLIGSIVLASLYFIASFVFLLLVSLFSCFFSDVISQRVENVMVDDRLSSLADGFMQTLKRFPRVLKNEIKKISAIAFFVMIAALFGLSGVLMPVGLLITWALVAVQFLDYSWCRHLYSFSDCIQDFKDHWIGYVLSGMIFSFALAVPFGGVLFFSFANIFFTCLFVKNQLEESPSE